MLSFRKGSSGSIPKVDAIETPREKHAFHINTKADPTKAINEAEPGELAHDLQYHGIRLTYAAVRNANEAITVESIRSIEHRDADGNIISTMPGYKIRNWH